MRNLYCNKNENWEWVNCGINGEIGNSIFFRCKARVEENALDKCMPIYMCNNVRKIQAFYEFT